MSIRIVKFASGHRFPMVAPGPWDPPDPWAAAYLLSGAWAGNNSPKTLRNKALAIEAGLAFCAEKGLADLPGLCRAGCLTRPQLNQLANRLRGAKAEPRATAPRYYSEFTRFLAWIRDSEATDPNDTAAADRITRFAAAVAACRPRGSERTTVPRYGLTEEQRDAFLRAIIPYPKNLRNPFRSMGFRNFVMMLASFTLGARSGELLGLKIEDIDFKVTGGRLRIAKRRHDPDDPRIWPAGQKTLARILPLGEMLADAFEELLAERRRSPAARRHPYVFVNRDGLPLSDRGFRAAYERLGRTEEGLAGLVNHQLRHDWNDRWNVLVRERGWDMEAALRIQAHAMGWTVGSGMSRRYGRRSIENQANKDLLEMQDRSLRRVSA